MIHRTNIVLAVLLLAAGGSPSAEVWTLDRAVRAAVSVSTGAVDGRLESQSNAADAHTARMAWYPAVSFTGSASYVDKVMELSVPTRSIRFGDNDTYDFKLRLNQVLFDGGRLNALRDAGLKRSEMNIRRAEASELLAVLEAKTAFFNVALAQENVNAARQSVLEAENHHADVVALRKEGMALEDDELLSRLRIKRVEMDQISRGADLDRARAVFRKALGLGPGEEVAVERESAPRKEPETAGVEEAYRLRPEFRAYEAALGAAEKTAEGVRAERLPMVGFSGSFSYGKPGLNLPQNEWMHYFTGGVSLSWNVWDWGKNDREAEKADIARRKTLNTIEELRRAVADQVAEAAAGCAEAEKRESLAGESAAYAERHLELVRASFKNGAATERDYDSAHAISERSRYDVAAARYALDIAKARMDYVLGIRYTGGNR